MNKEELLEKIKEEIKKSEAVRAMPAEVRKLFPVILKHLKKKDMLVLFRTLEKGNNEIETLKTKEREEAEKIVKVKAETDKLMIKGKKLVAQINSAKEHRDSGKQADQLIKELQS